MGPYDTPGCSSAKIGPPSTRPSPPGSGRAPFTGFGRAAIVGAQNSLMRRVLSTTPSQVAFDGACAKRAGECVALIAKWSSAAEDPSTVAPWVRAASQINLLGGHVNSRLVAEVALLHRTPPFSPSSGAVPLAIAQRASENYVEYYSHAVPFAPGALIDLWSRCRAPAGRRDDCRRGMSQAQLLLKNGAPGE